MEFTILDDIINKLNSNATELNSKEVLSPMQVSEYLKIAVDIISESTKAYKLFVEDLKDTKYYVYLTKQYNIIIKRNEVAVKDAVDYAGGNRQIDLPINIQMTYLDAKQKNEKFNKFYAELLDTLRQKTQQKAKDDILSYLHDLKYELVSIKNQLDNFDSKMNDMF